VSPLSISLSRIRISQEILETNFSFSAGFHAIYLKDEKKANQTSLFKDFFRPGSIIPPFSENLFYVPSEKE
jgi:hypothetical protein